MTKKTIYEGIVLALDDQENPVFLCIRFGSKEKGAWFGYTAGNRDYVTVRRSLKELLEQLQSWMENAD